jgi:5'-3' exonuclease
MSVDGFNTGPTYTFINILAKYVRQERPDRLVLCWDGGRSHFRRQLFAGYKSERHTKDENAVEEEHSIFDLTKEFLSLAGIHHVMLPGVEADDLVAYYWRTRDPQGAFVILSGDKDFLQLLDDGTEQIRPGVRPERWSAIDVLATMNCWPHDLPKAMALSGDASDGVPGVVGFGIKTAVRTLAIYGWNLNSLVVAAQMGDRKPACLKHVAADPEVVWRNFALINLREVHSSDDDPQLPSPPPFVPTSPESIAWGSLLDWLNQWQMESVKQRLLQASLWREDQTSLVI